MNKIILFYCFIFSYILTNYLFLKLTKSNKISTNFKSITLSIFTLFIFLMFKTVIEQITQI